MDVVGKDAAASAGIHEANLVRVGSKAIVVQMQRRMAMAETRAAAECPNLRVTQSCR